MSFRYTSHLDPDTASPYVHLSEHGKTATCVQQAQPHYPHFERFNNYMVVLCKEPLRGCKTWTVECKGKYIYIGVSYRSVEKNNQWPNCTNFFDYNDRAWCLLCSDDVYYAYHSATCNPIPAPFHTKKIKVTLNRPEGTLSFYAVSSPFKKTHLYTFHTTFIEDPYPVFGFRWYESSVSLV